MEPKQYTWMVLFILGATPSKITADRGMKISSERMTWLKSISYCTLPDEDSIEHLQYGEYRGWVGGIFSNSQWMIHKGCYSNKGSMNSGSVYDIKKLTPAQCSEKCKMNEYFALKHNWCLCLHSLYNLNEVDSSKCTYKCTGSNNYVCGERSHYTVYQHILGKFKPKSDADQKLYCSIIVPRNDTFLLKAVDCYSKYWTACVISGDTTQMSYKDTYQSAIRKCSSSNGVLLSTTDKLGNLVEGNEYWSNIIRSEFLKWITKESFNEVCYEVERLVNVTCVYLTVEYRKIEYIPIPCQYENHAICKHHGDSKLIRQCRTNNDTTTITSDQTDPEHSNTTPKKQDPVSTSLSTEPLFLTSLLATMSTHLELTTSDHTTLIPSSPKVVSKTIISSESSSVWFRSRTVSASSSQTSISDTTISKHIELTTLDTQTDINDRTVADETTNNGLVYSIIFSLVPAAAALAILIIMAVLITVVRRRRREKAHQERNGLQIEPGAIQPMIAYDNKSHGNQRNLLKTQDRGNPDYQIYDKADDQYQHIDFDVRRKEPECFEAENGYAMATTSFLKPDQKRPSSNSALKVAMAKRAKMLPTSLHFLHGQFLKQRSDKENVAYCDTAIVHTKFLYDTPLRSIKHVNKP